MADEYIDKVEVGAKIQMMYIRREMDYGGENDFCRGMRKALRVIKNMPCADVQPVKRGRWISQGDDMWLCSNCKENIIFSMHESDRTEKQRYCCKCGARMNGGAE